MSALFKFAVLFGLLFSNNGAAAQNCPCGYIDSNRKLWREAILSDFTQSAGALAVLNANWIIDNELLKQGGKATANIQYTPANVFQNAAGNGLGLKASAYDGSGAVKSAQIFTKKRDIQYGTFRTNAVIPTVPGAVFGFFTYINDSQEQDIEFLGSDVNYYQHLHYTNQPGSAAGATLDLQILGADFTAFGEHRIDWLPTQTIYYYKGNVSAQHTLTVNVPSTPSEFILNVWSNGDPGWSRGPPTSDAIATIKTVSLYFNSTSFTESQFTSACNAAGKPAPCSV